MAGDLGNISKIVDSITYAEAFIRYLSAASGHGIIRGISLSFYPEGCGSGGISGRIGRLKPDPHPVSDLDFIQMILLVRSCPYSFS